MLGQLGNLKGKWADGVLGDDGNIYALPHNADSVLAVDTQSESVSLVGNIVDAPKAQAGSKMNGNWVECLKASNGCVYGVPVHAASVLVFNPQPESTHPPQSASSSEERN